MPRFSVRDVLASTALIALGIGALRLVFDLGPGTNVPAIFVILGLWLIGGALIGAGIGLLFHRGQLGFALGLSIQTLLFIAVGLVA